MLRFALGLALRLGKTLGELAGVGPGLADGELSLWIAYLKDFDPKQADERRADERFGMILAMTANVHSSGRSFRPRDFFTSLAPPIEDDELEKMAMASANRIVVERIEKKRLISGSV